LNFDDQLGLPESFRKPCIVTSEQGEKSRFNCLHEYDPDTFLEDLVRRLNATYKVDVLIVVGKQGDCAGSNQFEPIRKNRKVISCNPARIGITGNVSFAIKGVATIFSTVVRRQSINWTQYLLTKILTGSIDLLPDHFLKLGGVLPGQFQHLDRVRVVAFLAVGK